MPSTSSLTSPDQFSAILYEKMKRINAGVEEMELYEFRYTLHNLTPEDGGWAAVEVDGEDEIATLGLASCSRQGSLRGHSSFVAVETTPRRKNTRSFSPLSLSS